jgi:hypothetical protein
MFAAIRADEVVVDIATTARNLWDVFRTLRTVCESF